MRILGLTRKILVMRRSEVYDPYKNAAVSFVGRPTCYECFRPKTHCLCGTIEPFRAHCNTMVLQHPNERGKYYSTAKILSKALLNLRLIRGLEFDRDFFDRSLKGQKAYLLYPGNDAVDCSEIPLDANSTVIAIDGTWREARKIIYRNSYLKELPLLSFKNSIASIYRIRKQPKFGCLSTLESLGHLLKLNAAISGATKLIEHYNSLFDGFQRMIQQQISYWPARKN